jgi:hypothetical protein
MEENAKKTLLIVVAVACLAVAGIVTYKTMGGGGTTAGQPASKVWVKCNNPKCGNEYEVSAQEYNTFVMNNGGPRQFMMTGAVPMKCPKCNEDSAFKAEKCEKCGKVFFPGTVEGKAQDTCPGCGYSPSEAAAKGA